MKQIKLLVGVFIAITCYGSDSHSSEFEIKEIKDTVEDTLVNIVIKNNDDNAHVILGNDHRKHTIKMESTNGLIINDPLLVTRPTR